MTWRVGLVFAASFVAGILNAVAGGGTLLSFPALVWLGVPPIVANATNTVALWPGGFASVVGFRRDIANSRRWIPLLVGPSLLGGAVGAFLLLRTPEDVFKAIAPFLVLAATLLLALQEPLARRFQWTVPRTRSHVWILAAVICQFLVAIYGGFFGAGIGILLLGALALLGLEDIHEMNGLKNLFTICINGMAAIYFAVSGAVVWFDVAIMATAAIAGGYGGARLAYRMGRLFIRRFVVVVGLLATVSLVLRLFV